MSKIYFEQMSMQIRKRSSYDYNPVQVRNAIFATRNIYLASVSES